MITIGLAAFSCGALNIHVGERERGGGSSVLRRSNDIPYSREREREGGGGERERGSKLQKRSMDHITHLRNQSKAIIILSS